DVLLYNFFGTSPLKSQWRVVYGYMKEQNLLDSNDAKFPKFIKGKHQILCSELKQLYVAITRTRQRLWIFEKIDDFSKPMFDYWKKLCLVQERALDESLVQAMQVTSSKEEWISRGSKLLDEGNFEMATMCFERAGDSSLEKLAKASGLRAAGVHMLDSNIELARVALVEAAEIYESIGKADLAAKCFMELKDFKRAGMIYLENCGESRLEDAADCFSLAGCWSTAADVYSRCNSFSKCLLVCTNARSENFMEAASVARLKGDCLLEADMLEKAGHLVDAAEVILFYVLCNSVWANGNEGWPLKKFPNKDKLLAKVQMMAKNKDDSFYQFITTEASLLSESNSGLSEMNDCFIASQRFKSLRGEIISLRKIIDFHLDAAPSEYVWLDDVVLNTTEHVENSISKNRVSTETLTYFWNLWKERIVNIMQYLNSLGTQDKPECKGYENFCLGYLGVYKQVHDQSSMYILLNSDACWRKEIEDRFLRKTRKLLGMNDRQFASSARSYWFSTLLSVCLQVLEKLEKLYEVSGIQKVGNDFFMHSYSHFRKGMTALLSYQVAKSTIELKIPDKKLPGELLKYLKHSKLAYYSVICLTDPKKEMFKLMMDLRLTEPAKDLIKEVAIEIMSSKGKLHFAEMWSVVLLIFMFGNLSEELYQVMIQRSDLDPAYKALIHQLKENKISGLVSVSLVSNFQKLLQETFNYEWTISFSWFVYFLERLLFLVSSWHGSFFTLMSSVRETIPWGNLRCNSSSLSEADSKVFSRRSFDFIASKIKEIFSSKLGMLWERDSDGCAYYPWLVRKLVLLVTLICLNSGCHFDLLYSLLSRYDIITVLPPVFAMIILEKRGTRPFGKLVADILAASGDPLVCLRSGNIQREFLSYNVLEIDVDLIHSREDILGILYPENLECDRYDDMEDGSPSEEYDSFSNFDHMSYAEYSTESDGDIPDSGINLAEFRTKTEEYDIKGFHQLFTNIARVYMFNKRIFEDISFHDCTPQMKLDIIICFVESRDPFCKDKIWVRQLKQLSLELSASDEEDPDIQYAKIDDCFKNLTVHQIVKKYLIQGLFGLIIKFTPYSKKIKIEERRKSKKQAGKNAGKNKGKKK
ncbi:hypothetical protein MKW94_007686, partial [Papaver nudicaule]|nr:hypothetical protein [Papaver nudicaule]